MRKLAITLAVTAALVSWGFLRGGPEATTSTAAAGIGAHGKGLFSGQEGRLPRNMSATALEASSWGIAVA